MKALKKLCLSPRLASLAVFQFIFLIALFHLFLDTSSGLLFSQRTQRFQTNEGFHGTRCVTTDAW